MFSLLPGDEYLFSAKMLPEQFANGLHGGLQIIPSDPAIYPNTLSPVLELTGTRRKRLAQFRLVIPLLMAVCGVVVTDP
jgi:hypothetical protein